MIIKIIIIIVIIIMIILIITIHFKLINSIACSIRQNKNMQGMKIGKEEVKLALFANDLSCFVKNYTSSYE